MQKKLTQYKLFQGLDESECARIERSGEWVRAPKGRAIIAQKRVNNVLFIVVEGAVNVQISESTGTEIELASHGPGMMIGEYSFIDGLPAAASAVTTTDAVLFMISHETLNEILARHDRIGRIVYRNLLEILVARLRATNAELDLFA